MLSTSVQHDEQLVLPTLESYSIVTPSLLERALHFLHERDVLLSQSTHAMDRPRGQIDLIFSHNASVRPDERFSTREVISGVLLQLPQAIQEIWQDVRDGGPGDNNQLRKVYCWAFKSLTDVNSDKGIVIKNRSKGMPYAVHTHVDVPFAIRTIVKGDPTPLALAVACSHDTKEEGAFVVWNEQEKIPVRCEFDVSKLQELFPQEDLGTRLMISIPTLTESPYEEMAPFVDMSELKASIEALRDTDLSSLMLDRESAGFQKFFVEHPLVFGGLALQVKLMVQSLLENPCKDEELAYAIALTEIADRISDVSTMEYYFNYQSEFGAEGAHRRVLCFAARIQNMAEKIESVIPFFTDQEHRKDLTNGVAFLGTLLEYKIKELGMLFRDEPLAIFNEKELSAHAEMMRQIQQNADIYMHSFIADKVKAIQETAYGIAV